MASLSFSELWINHPYPSNPCDTKLFENQCAIRMGVALGQSGLSLKNFSGYTCAGYPALKHATPHIRSAEELANWLKEKGQAKYVGEVKRYTKKVSFDNFIGQNGIVFIKDGWPSGGDHIDVWDGTALAMKGGRTDYFTYGQEVWFWKLQ